MKPGTMIANHSNRCAFAISSRSYSRPMGAAMGGVMGAAMGAVMLHLPHDPPVLQISQLNCMSYFIRLLSNEASEMPG